MNFWHLSLCACLLTSITAGDRGVGMLTRNLAGVSLLFGLLYSAFSPEGQSFDTALGLALILYVGGGISYRVAKRFSAAPRS